MRFAALGLIAALASAPTWAQPETTPAAGLVREGVTEKLTDHVWAIPDGSASLVPNVGIIVGSRAVLVVDTGMGARNAETVLREVAKVGSGRPIYLVTTHVHPEHDLGAHAFPKGSQLIRSKDQETDIAASGMTLAEAFAARSPLNAELLMGAVYRPADISFNHEYELDLGGVIARIVAMGLNHTLGDTVVLVDGVLFSGDVAMQPQPSVMAEGATISHWMQSLDKLDAMRPAQVVPSHGPRGNAGIIMGYRIYFMQVRNRTSALKGARRTLEQVTDQVTTEMASQYPDKQRMAEAVKAAYAEAM